MPTNKTVQGIREAVGSRMLRDTSRDWEGCPEVSLPYGNGSLFVSPLAKTPMEMANGVVPPSEVERVREQLRAVADKLGDEDVDIQDILLMKWIEAANVGGPDTVAHTTLDDILHQRGVAKKQGGSGGRGGYRPGERKRIWDTVVRLRHLYVQAAEEVWKGNKRSSEQVRSYVVAVTDEVGVGEDGVPYGFRYRPGKMLADLLLQDMRQYTYLSRQVLKYHPVNHAVEKRLARLFAYRWRVDRKKERSLRVRIGQIIEKSGEAERFEKRPDRVRARIEKALDRLRKDGVIDSWSYDGWGTASAGTDRGLQAWAAAALVVSPPPDLLRHLRTIGRETKRGEPRPPS